MSRQRNLDFTAGPGERDVYVEPTQERLKSVKDQIAQAKMNLRLLNRQIPDSMTSTTRMELLTELLDVADLLQVIEGKISGDLT